MYTNGRLRQNGQITVFSVIILLAVMILAGVLVDISRISAGRSIVKSAADTAAESLLAEYGGRLKEDYGLFTMATTDKNELEDRFEEYLNCNLSIPGEEAFYKGRADLFGFRVERISVTPVFNLSENSVTKQQILEYMKYRAPTELVEGFVKKISAIKDVGKMSAAYKKKVGIDKILGGMDKSQQKLKKYVDGLGNTAEKYINGFNSGGSWEAAFNSFNSLSASFSTISSRLDSIDGNITELEEQLRKEEKEAKNSTRDSGNSGDYAGNANEAGNSEKTARGSASTGNRATNTSADESENSETGSEVKDAVAETKALIDSLKSGRSSLEQDYSGTNSKLQTGWNEIRYSLTGDYIEVNDNAVDEIEKVVKKGQKAQLAISDLENYINSNFGTESGEFSKDFREQTQYELDKLKALILNGQKAEEMLNKIKNNGAVLKDLTQKLDTARNGMGSSASAAGLPSELLDIIKNYANISYNYSKPEKGDKKDDPRNGKAEAVKKFIFEKVLKDVNYTTAGIVKEDLPSCTKVVTGDFEQEDAEFTGGRQNEPGNGSIAGTGAEYGGSLENVGIEADFYDEEGMLQENALGFISDIGNMISENTAALRDNIYLNEYIMGTFKTSVPEIMQQNEIIKDTNLHGGEKVKLPTFYDSEVEYVLHGNASQKLNNIMTRGELLLVRFGLNTLHVYTDAKKKTMAASIATAVAGWWTGGAGIPVISNMVMCGWGMGESLIDVQELMEGKSVPLYKMKGDWRLDIGLPSQSTPKTDKKLYFNYYDYLRLFLLTMDENKKLNRVEDLIQLNIGKSKSGFKMSGSNTYVRIEAEVSMKYLFITRPFVQRTLKTNDGRYMFKVLLYEGYQ